MSEFAGQKVGQNRGLYVSAGVESPFMTAAAVTHCLEHNLSSEPLERMAEKIGSRNFSSRTASDHSSRSRVVGYNLDGPYELYATLEALGIFTASVMAGGDTKTGSVAPYVHALAYAALPPKLHGRTIKDLLAGPTWNAATDREHLGVAVSSVRFEVERTGNARLKIGVKGSGKVGSGGTVTEAGLVIPTELIRWPKCRVCLASCPSNGTTAWDGTLEVGTLAGVFPAVDAGVPAITDYLESFAFQIDLDCDDGGEGGSSESAGVYKGRRHAGDNRKVTVEMKAIYGTPFESLLHAAADQTDADQKQHTILFNIVSDTAAHGFAAAFPVCELQGPARDMAGSGVLKPSFTFEALVSGANQPIVAKVADNSPQTYYPVPA